MAKRIDAMAVSFIVATAIMLGSSKASAYDWLQFNGDPQHSGNNTAETIISPANVASLTRKFQIDLPAVVDGAPVLLQGVTTATGVRDVLFVTTTGGDLVAIDAQTGIQLWVRRHPAGMCTVNNGLAPCYTTSSPAIDPNRQLVYSYGLDGYVHKHRIFDGTEIMDGTWPELTTTKGFDEKGSSALALATSKGVTYLYAVHGGYPGDRGDYQGHVTAIELATGAQRVFNAMCSDQPVHFATAPANPNCSGHRSAIWSRPGVVYDPLTDHIFVATGNGGFDGGSAAKNWSESVLALHPDGGGSGGKPIDSYTPTVFDSLDSADADLGSTAPAIMSAPAGVAVSRLALQIGKDAKLRLIDLADLSGQASPGHTGGELNTVVELPQGGGVLAQPAVWKNPDDGSSWVFVSSGNGMAALKVVNAGGRPSLVEQWRSAYGGTSPLIANNVVYHAASGVLLAFDAAKGQLLWSTNDIGNVHWQSPLVANGSVFIADDAGRLTAFALPAAANVAVVEFYNVSLDHYFVSSLRSEIEALDSSRPAGWSRTGLSFYAYPRSTATANPVCRFYIPPAYGDSHFYSASPEECAAVQARFPFFDYESLSVFYVSLPDKATGACPDGTLAVYRVWDNRVDTNHRYTTSRAVRDQMVATGWIAEGYGDDAVIMCSPK